MFTPPSVRPLAVGVIVLTLALVAVSEIPAAENGEEGTKPGETKWGTFGLEFRYRFPWIDDDAFTEAGYASSLRTGLSYETPGWRGSKAGAVPGPAFLYQVNVSSSAT